MFYSEVTHKHGSMPFNLRNFEDEKKAKMAVVECVNHKLIEPFQVLYEKSGMLRSKAVLLYSLCVIQSPVAKLQEVVEIIWGGKCRQTVVHFATVSEFFLFFIMEPSYHYRHCSHVCLALLPATEQG
jgi:hypothetical protein